MSQAPGRALGPTDDDQLTLEDFLGHAVMPQPAQEAQQELVVHYVRDAEPGEGRNLAPTTSVLQIRHTHHMIAQLLAQGKSQTEVSMLVGKSPQTIGRMRNDPAFQELEGFYKDQRQEIFAESMFRLNAIGLSAMEEIQSRLDDDEVRKKMTHGQLMDLVEASVLRPLEAKTKATATGAAAPINVAVSFVEAPAREPSGPIIDLGPETEDGKAD